MTAAFASEHSLCTNHCNAVNSNTDVTSATYNVCAGYLTIWWYSNDNFDTKEYICRLSQLFYEGQLGKAIPLCFHYPLCHKEKKKCLGCLYELKNDYELDIHEWELLVL